MFSELVLQDLVFAHMDLFFSHVGTEGLDVANTIAETARGNRALAAQVHESGSIDSCVAIRQVLFTSIVVFRTFIQSIVKFGKQPKWLKFLDAFVVVEGRPLKRNQTLVLKLVLRVSLMEKLIVFRIGMAGKG